MPRHNDTWKDVERAIARYVGGERLSNHALGLETPDVETEHYSIEVKHRKALPQWIVAAMAQARRNASAGKLPLVILHQAGARHDNDLVVMRLRDMAEMGAWAGEDKEG